MGCKIWKGNKCTRKGDDVRATVVVFETDITEVQFYYEVKNIFDVRVELKTLGGGGLRIIAPNKLVIEKHIETKEAGKYTSFLKLIENGNPRTPFSWAISVKKEEAKTS